MKEKEKAGEVGNLESSKRLGEKVEKDKVKAGEVGEKGENFKKRILVLNYEFPPLGGGASPVSYELAKGYAKLGNKVDVVTMGMKGLKEYKKIDGINVYRVKCLRSKKEICHPWEQLSYIISAKKFLKKHMKNSEYDICHCHFIIPTGILALWLKKKFGLKYIITSYGSDLPGYNPDRFKLIHKFTKPTIKNILNNSYGAFAGSKYLTNLGNLIEAKINYKVIREGFDSTKFHPKEKKKIILSTGRLLERKGFQYLIKAVSEDDLGYEVHICGDGPMMGELKELKKKSKTKIILHGWIDNNSKEYKNLLESASIYSLVSKKENASVSLLEAMSAGCAVITSNVSGCPETIGDSGIAINTEDFGELKLKLLELIKNEKKIKKLGKMARERVLEKYDWNKIIEEYLEVLR